MSEKVEKVIVDNIFNHKKRDLTHFGYFWFGFVMFNATWVLVEFVLLDL
jgi:hypothetical protein